MLLMVWRGPNGRSAAIPRLRWLCAASAVVLTAAMPVLARAETLAEAIALAYQSNPTLQAQRAQAEGVDEGYVQARAQMAPSVQLQATSTYQQDLLGTDHSRGTIVDPSSQSHVESNTGSSQLVLSQPLYSGGRTAAAVNQASSQIQAARQALRAVEGNVVYAVIQAYADVLRDEQSLEVRRTNLAELVKQAAETRARQKDGELTTTDVAQADAQVSAERALLIAAEGQLATSRAEYVAAVGQNPGTLQPQPELPGLPKDVDAAFDIGAATSPELAQALFTERASEAQVTAARAANNASVNLRASLGYSAELEPWGQKGYDREFVAEAVLTKPIFTGGLNASQIRQALDQNTSDRLSIEIARRTLIQNIANAWNQILVQQATVTAQEQQIAAATIAYNGMKIEYRAGERSTLDVLIAEETLRDAEIALIAARHDGFVAKAALLRYLGRLEAADLILGLNSYDPAAHLHKVAGIGLAPWTPALTHVDAIGAPAANTAAIPTPPPAEQPHMAPADGPITTNIQLLDSSPTAPIPGTVGAYTPTEDQRAPAYVKLSGGLGSQGKEKWDRIDYTMSHGYEFGVTGGVFVSHSVSIEADVLHSDAEYRCCTTHLRSNSFLADTLYHFDPVVGLNPYLGAGVGMMDVYYDGGGHYWSDWVLGGQLLAGVEVPISERLSAILEYRYQLTARPRHDDVPYEYRSQNLMTGLKFEF